MAERDLSFYETFTRLVKIHILGKTFEAPENNIVLRCVQYIVNDDVVPGRFCWNNECGNCEFVYQTPDGGRQRTRGCQTVVEDGMILTELSPDLRYWLGSKLK